MNLNFSISELCHSNVAKKYNIDNTPNIKICDNLLLLIFNVLQPLRDNLGKPIIITSGYRCEKLNRHPEINGALNSEHIRGYAVDFIVNKAKTEDVVNWVRKQNIKWTQLIDEHSKNTSWVHISYNPNNLKCEVLKYKNGMYSKL